MPATPASWPPSRDWQTPRVFSSTSRQLRYLRAGSAGETRTVFTNDHLGYAVTWYGLAAALLLVFLSFAWTRLGGRSEEPRLTPPGGAP